VRQGKGNGEQGGGGNERESLPGTKHHGKPKGLGGQRELWKKNKGFNRREECHRRSSVVSPRKDGI